MSFMCAASKELVIGERCILIPSQIRKVIYVAQTRPDYRSDFLKFAGQSEGWEIVKEVPVRASMADIYREFNPPKVVGEKEVRFLQPNPPRESYVPRENASSDKPQA